MVSKKKLSIVAAAVILVALLITGTVFAAAEYLNIPLNNDTAGEGTDCPVNGGPYWHFVISPNNGNSYFITFHLNLGDASTYDTSVWVDNGSQLDNVFVAVPSGKVLTSLIKSGSSADIYWNGTGTEPAKFQLSHTCPGAQNLKVTKTAVPSFTRVFDWTIEKSANTELIKTPDSATFKYTISVFKKFVEDKDFAVNGKITVENPNNFAFDGVVVTDTTLGVDCPVVNGQSVSIPAKSSVVLDYACVIVAPPVLGAPQVNTATAAWDQIKYLTPGDHSAGTAGYVFSQPTKKILDEIDVTDSHEGVGPWHFTDSGSVSYNFTYPNDPSGTCTEHKNVATITQNGASDDAVVKVCVGKPLQIDKTVKPTFTRTYKWEIQKVADPKLIKTAADATFNYKVSVTKLAGVDSDWAVSGVITVKNLNDWESVTFNVNDSVPGGTCTVTGGSSVTLAANASKEFPYICTFAAQPPYNVDITNTATAAWDKAAAFTLVDTATIEKTFQFTTPTKLVNDEIDVIDSRLPGSRHFTVSGTWEYAYTYTGDPAGTCTNHENVASIVPPTASDHPDARATVTVCVGTPLKVSKTAVPQFTRTYLWDLSKGVDKTYVRQIGGTATFNYTVKAWQTGFKDSNWKVSGTIHVTNPNDWEAIEFSYSDSVNNGGTCLLPQVLVPVPANSSVDLGYECSYPETGPTSINGINTAKAKWDKAAYFTNVDEASGTAPFDFTAPTTTVNKTITVTDTFDGITTPLGTVTATDAAPFAAKTFTYSHTVPVPTSACKEYTNTAKIVETGKEASVTVKVCTMTGARTMGYWQNKNGQGLITKYCGGAADKSLFAFLTAYNPFKDLTASDCSGIATYVTKIIKAANASGASMNAMLKGQMLATALDVYFSDPALGGVKLSDPTPPAPIGGVMVQLGTSSAAFGGATELTVSQLLEYAAGQSNSGGSVWYAQVKQTQELAKNVFDGINNDRDPVKGMWPDFPSENYGTSYIFIPAVVR